MFVAEISVHLNDYIIYFSSVSILIMYAVNFILFYSISIQAYKN